MPEATKRILHRRFRILRFQSAHREERTTTVATVVRGGRGIKDRFYTDLRPLLACAHDPVANASPALLPADRTHSHDYKRYRLSGNAVASTRRNRGGGEVCLRSGICSTVVNFTVVDI